MTLLSRQTSFRKLFLSFPAKRKLRGIFPILINYLLVSCCGMTYLAFKYKHQQKFIVIASKHRPLQNICSSKRNVDQNPRNALFQLAWCLMPLLIAAQGGSTVTTYLCIVRLRVTSYNIGSR